MLVKGSIDALVPYSARPSVSIILIEKLDILSSKFLPLLMFWIMGR